MVRLKEFANNSLDAQNFVSIPYGSIKRYFKKSKQLKIKLVSIPYGSIKSQHGHHALSRQD